MSNIESASVADTQDEFVDLEEGGTSLNKEKSQNTSKTNKRKKRSDVWNHFEVLNTGTNDFATCKCKYCGHKYNKISSKTGTGNLRRHIETCPRRNTHDVGDMMLSKSVAPRFDPEHFRELVCSAVVVHGLPFCFVEYERIVACFEYLRHDVKLVSRNTLKTDVLKLYEREKMRIKSMLKESIKYVRGSQMRKQKFFECVSMVSLSSKKGLRQDVPTRWNSTFLMLDSALYYRKAFLNLQLSDHNYKNCPSLVEWERVEKICSFLALFYEVSNMFCGSKYPTSNLYFRPIITCYASLRQSKDTADEYIKKMASQMLSKFEKYWHNFSLILTIAAVFDPRYKLQFVEFSYNKLYGPNSHQYLQVKERLFALFDEYYKMCPSQEESNTMGVPHPSSSYENELAIAMVEEFNAFDTEFGLSQQKSQLELYLEEPRMDVKVNLDILEYWKGNQYRYPVVASIARDILCIPLTTVASESVFSVGGRVLDQYRSALTSNAVEAIICTRDWLYGEKVGESVLPIKELVENVMDETVSQTSTECSTFT